MSNIDDSDDDDGDDGDDDDVGGNSGLQNDVSVALIFYSH